MITVVANAVRCVRISLLGIRSIVSHRPQHTEDISPRTMRSLSFSVLFSCSRYASCDWMRLISSCLASLSCCRLCALMLLPSASLTASAGAMALFDRSLKAMRLSVSSVKIRRARNQSGKRKHLTQRASLAIHALYLSIAQSSHSSP